MDIMMSSYCGVCETIMMEDTGALCSACQFTEVCLQCCDGNYDSEAPVMCSMCKTSQMSLMDIQDCQDNRGYDALQPVMIVEDQQCVISCDDSQWEEVLQWEELPLIESEGDNIQKRQRFACEFRGCEKTGSTHTLMLASVSFLCNDHFISKGCSFCSLRPFPLHGSGLVATRKRHACKTVACPSCFCRIRTAIDCIILRMQRAASGAAQKDIVHKLVMMIFSK